VATPVRGAAEAELDRFRDRLLLRLLQQSSSAELDAALRHAANEAAALSWMTPFPLLFLPALVEEKAQSVLRHAARQARIKRGRSGVQDQAA
jgi:hypothetical protein